MDLLPAPALSRRLVHLRYLQHLDSEIADEILRLMTKAKIPVLCVHDSFIVAVQHEQDLVRAISHAYARVLKEKLGFSARGLVWLKRTDTAGCERFQIEVPPLSILPNEARNQDAAEVGFDGNTLAQSHRTQRSTGEIANTHRDKEVSVNYEQVLKVEFPGFHRHLANHTCGALERLGTDVAKVNVDHAPMVPVRSVLPID